MSEPAADRCSARITRRPLVLAAFVLASAFGAFDAAAQQCANPLISTCINSDTYWPHAGPQRFSAVGGSETLANRGFGFGLVTSYLSRPIVIDVPSPGAPGSKQYAIDNQVNANFLFAYGLTDRFQIDVGVPITLVQSGAGVSPLTGGDRVSDTAVRDMRFGYAYTLVPRRNEGFGLAHRLAISAPVGDNTSFAGEQGVVFVPSLALDYRLSRFFFGAELGARIRQVTEFAGARVGTQETTALGAGVDILPKNLLSFFLEGRAMANFAEQHTTQQSAFGTRSTPNGKWIVPAEWTAGLRTAPLLDGNVSFFFGGGGPLPITDASVTVPRFRFTLGITYAPTQRAEKRP